MVITPTSPPPSSTFHIVVVVCLNSVVSNDVSSPNLHYDIGFILPPLHIGHFSRFLNYFFYVMLKAEVVY